MRTGLGFFVRTAYCAVVWDEQSNQGLEAKKISRVGSKLSENSGLAYDGEASFRHLDREDNVRSVGINSFLS